MSTRLKKTVSLVLAFAMLFSGFLGYSLPNISSAEGEAVLSTEMPEGMQKMDFNTAQIEFKASSAENRHPLDIAHWRTDGGVEGMLDCEPGTSWHTRWSTDYADAYGPIDGPHTLDLIIKGDHAPITGFMFQPRSSLKNFASDVKVFLGDSIEEVEALQELSGESYQFSLPTPENGNEVYVKLSEPTDAKVIRLEFTPTGGEQFLAIGEFRPLTAKTDDLIISDLMQSGELEFTGKSGYGQIGYNERHIEPGQHYPIRIKGRTEAGDPEYIFFSKGLGLHSTASTNISEKGYIEFTVPEGGDGTLEAFVGINFTGRSNSSITYRFKVNGEVPEGASTQEMGYDDPVQYISAAVKAGDKVRIEVDGGESDGSDHGVLGGLRITKNPIETKQVEVVREEIGDYPEVEVIDDYSIPAGEEVVVQEGAKNKTIYKNEVTRRSGVALATGTETEEQVPGSKRIVKRGAAMPDPIEEGQGSMEVIPRYNSTRIHFEAPDNALKVRIYKKVGESYEFLYDTTETSGDYIDKAGHNAQETYAVTVELPPATEGETVLVPQELSREGVNVQATSECNPPKDNDGPATWAFDGDEDSYWHTSWGKEGDGKLPQAIAFTLPEAKKIAQIDYLSRGLGAGKNGNIKNYKVYGREDEVTLEHNTVPDTTQGWTELAAGELENSNDWHKITMTTIPETPVKQVMVVVTGSYGEQPNQFVNAKEFKLYSQEEQVLPPSGENQLKLLGEKQADLPNGLDAMIAHSVVSHKFEGNDKLMLKAEDVYHFTPEEIDIIKDLDASLTVSKFLYTNTDYRVVTPVFGTNTGKTYLGVRDKMLRAQFENDKNEGFEGFNVNGNMTKDTYATVAYQTRTPGEKFPSTLYRKDAKQHFDLNPNQQMNYKKAYEKGATEMYLGGEKIDDQMTVREMQIQYFFITKEVLDDAEVNAMLAANESPTGTDEQVPVDVSLHLYDDVTDTKSVEYKTPILSQLETPTREGYNFVKWTKDAAGEEELTAEDIANAKVNDVYAQWEEQGAVTMYNISFATDGHALFAKEDADLVHQQIPEGTKWADVQIPRVEPLEGFEFVRWDPAIPTEGVVSQDQTFRAIHQETEANTVVIEFTTDGHGILNEIELVEQELPIGATWAEVEVPTYEPLEGYKFEGWDPELPAEDTVLNESQMYTARFVRDETQLAKVNFTTDGHGRLEGEIEQFVKAGKTPTVPTVIPMEGYEFEKWVKVTAEGEVDVEDPATLTLEGDTVYRAIFKEEEPEITPTITLKKNYIAVDQGEEVTEDMIRDMITLQPEDLQLTIEGLEDIDFNEPGTYTITLKAEGAADKKITIRVLEIPVIEKTVEITERTTKPYKKITIVNPERLLSDGEVVMQEGQNGITDQTYVYTYHGTELVSKVAKGDPTVVQEIRHLVVEVGTKIVLPSDVNKVPLEQLVDDALRLEGSLFTEETFRPFQRRLLDAQRTLQLYESTQEDVDKAYEALRKSMDALVEKDFYQPYTGWKKEGNYWRYYEEDFAVRGWKTIDGHKYFFRYESGTMVTGWQKIDAFWRYFNSQGHMVDGWIQVDGKVYFLRYGTGTRVDGKQYIDGAWRLFRADGVLTEGFIKIGNYTYYTRLRQGYLKGWQSINGATYYFRPSGTMVTSYQKIDGQWYFFKNDGRLQGKVTR